MDDIKTLVNTALNQKPAEFASTFNDIIIDRVRNAVEVKKNDLAQNMFNDKPEESEEPSDA